MPTLKDTADTCDKFTGTLSELSRKLCFAGIAVIWMLKNTSVDVSLNSVLVWFVVSLFFDLLQYVYASAIWSIYFRFKEKRLLSTVKKEEDVVKEEFLYPPKINWLTTVFFWLKVSICLVGQIMLVHYMYGQLF